jgi:hypothetical protein
MVAEQLEELLDSMYRETVLPPEQLNDFQVRVLPHLGYVAVERRVNPREVKRYLNTYTLQTLVRPELDRDTVLTLQTLIFRYEWRPLYDAILTDSMLFVDALKRYREGDDFAFEDLAAEMKVLPAGLGEFLRSGAADALCRHDSLDPYLSSLESTGTIPRWLSEAYGDLGRLRAEIRRVRAIEGPTEQDGVHIATIAKEVLSRLSGAGNLVGESRAAQLEGVLRQLRTLAQQIEARAGGDNSPDAPAGPLISTTATKMYEISSGVYRELRALRDATAPAPVS